MCRPRAKPFRISDVAWQTARVKERFDLLAPDGSEIRLLVQVPGGSMVHCRLPSGTVTQAVQHRTVDEVWLCTAGRGQLWRRDSEGEEVVELEAGVAVSIPLGTRFQFRAPADSSLEVAITTMPPWPGPDEAVAVDGTWAPSV
jgi:mannose-6-phosphate isomerase-like protein (cupin superfamily)